MFEVTVDKIHYTRQRNHYEDDDIIDRLNNRYTVLFLVLSISVISGNLFMGEPINCWTPVQFSDMHDNYAKSICWLKGSYYLPTNEISIPDRSKPRTYFVSYYQWTPFILMIMAVFFLLPRFIWRFFSLRKRIDLRKWMNALKNSEGREKTIEELHRDLNYYLQTKGFYWPGHFNLNIVTAYGIVKFIYIINTIIQFIALNSFLSFHFTNENFDFVNFFLYKHDWFESPRFPRVTMCDFMIRHLGSNQHWYSVQCNLPINMYNEKIFFILWIWLIILIILNFSSLVFWFIVLMPHRRRATIMKYLKIRSASSSKVDFQTKSSQEEISKLINCLTVDGYFIVRLIALNTDDFVAAELVERCLQTNRRYSDSDVV